MHVIKGMVGCLEINLQERPNTDCFSITEVVGCCDTGMESMVNFNAKTKL